MSDSHVYVHCKNHHWVPARVVEKQGDNVTVTIPQYSDEQRILSDGGKGAVKHIRQTVSLADYPNKVLPLQNVDEMGWLNEEKDMVDLPFLHEAAILYNLKSRHVKGKPYTRTGDIVIAVNPYEWFHNLYTKERRQEYARKLLWEPENGDARRVLEPHVYETSSLSYKGLTLEGMNQSILVSGESGAGKTETVKICMNHIAMVQQGPDANQAASAVVERVVESNPLLEAFGNAQTRRNDNSSRFGKYLQLQFTKGEKKEMPWDQSRYWQDCKLAGSQSEVYLLEKSRVVQHEDEERTFHIFYQLLAAPDSIKEKFWPKLVGKTNESFTYVGATKTSRIEGKSDAQHFQDTLSALALVNITGNKLRTLMQAISTVLQLGNIVFSGCTDKSTVSTMTELGDLAELMGVSTDTLEASLTKRTMRTTRETVMVDLNAEAAKESCDALAKSIYHEAFLWLVREINSATKAENSNNGYTGEYGIIGLLDIFGFECFQKNSFEQLCINYANEKLQQKFTEDIFRQVQAEYQYEGLALEDIHYEDNHHVLNLIESRMGLLDMLNEECVRPKGNDKEFVYKGIQQNKDSKALIVEKRFSPYEFGIHHYAGDVIYTAGNFVGKNNDTLGIDLKQCAGLSTNEIIAGVPAAAEIGPKRPVGRRNANSTIAAATVWTKYKTGLQNLMGELRKTNSRYIRCIKPNEMKKPAIMQHGPTLDQLRSAGVIAAVTITRSAFPNRLDHESVLDRFRHLARKTDKLPADDSDLGKRVERLIKPLLKHMTKEADGRKLKAYAIGKTRTYFRAGALEYLEAERIRGFDPAAMVIQKVSRGFLVRKRQRNDYIRDRGSALLIQTCVRVLLAKNKVMRMKDQKELLEKMHCAATVINAIARGAFRRMRFLEELRYYREVTAMKNELASLQEQVVESERQKKEAVEAAEARVQEAMAMLRDEQSSQSSADADASETARQLQERNKMIEKMRSDNKRVRANIKIVENKFKRLKEESTKKKSESEKELERFLKMNEDAKKMNEENAKAVANQGIWKKQVVALVEELKRTQESFQEATTSRAQYQETMANILKMLRTRCKEEQLIEDSIFIALESDSESKAIRASFDAVQAHFAEKEKSRSIPKDINGSSDSEDPADENLGEDNEPTEMTEDTSSSVGGGHGSDCSVSSPDMSEDDLDIDFEKEDAEMEAELAQLAAEVEGM